MNTIKKHKGFDNLGRKQRREIIRNQKIILKTKNLNAFLPKLEKENINYTIFIKIFWEVFSQPVPPKREPVPHKRESTLIGKQSEYSFMDGRF